MSRRNMRVIVASEYSQTRDLLREIVERENGAVIVGQAENATRALTLARSLRPDIALVDCYLPHVAGRDASPLSRIGGLDTAQIISGETPNTRVILLSNLDTVVLPEHGPGLSQAAVLTRKTNGSTTTFMLRELFDKVVPADALVFADVVVRAASASGREESLSLSLSLSDKALLFGGLGIFAGWFLTLTMVLAQVGVALIAAGGITMLTGLLGRTIASLRRKSRNRANVS